MDFITDEEKEIDSIRCRLDALENITQKICEVILWQPDCAWQEIYEPLHEYVRKYTEVKDE